MTTRESYSDALGRLRAAQKPAARSAPAYSRYVNRRIGRVLAAVCHSLGLSPNAITGISAVFTFVGIAILALVPPGVGVGICVALLLLLGYAFDSADGQVARLRGVSSPAGEWLDHVVDATKVSAMPLALAVGFYRFDAVERWWLLVPILSAVVSAVLFFAMILTEQLRRQHGAASLATDGPGRPSWLRAVLVLPMDYGVLCLSFLFLGAMPVFLALYTFIAAATALFLIAALVKWFREMTTLGRPA
ncbi:CDP-alcohol phosphatidyltransferase family protein [Salinibacterium sp. dk2585]|uniref:CDP-alcohol phosphatidyltransferase family protein n=1 Tax=unclassified Salinibacterium TaxID=2632331 RepID=UPI0011C24F6D|nr:MULTISPECIES: CDP-alcohol phosphatidyltransferase family protein [unclassified Salinibacterium]QEE60494.1 CDP-alcohol phosphatidyltransferase family protein [Salinibacterium sp. dk2585]TXK55566.1 CDP-alcohol phosphatidyltransferase family protein [Salinibacterium sp. dk5596]